MGHGTIALVVAAALAAAPHVGAQPTTVDELRAIGRSLDGIRSLLEQQALSLERGERERLLLERLRIQADRLVPLEDEVSALRLRRMELEQDIAQRDVRLRELEERIRKGERHAGLWGRLERETWERDALQARLALLLPRLDEVVSDLAVERSGYDDLAAVIDRRLGLRGR